MMQCRRLSGWCWWLIAWLSCGNTVPGVGATNYVVNGAGSTFAATTFGLWEQSYVSNRSQYDWVTMSYAQVGSGTGLMQLKNFTAYNIVFAGYDNPLSNSDYVQFPDFQMFPSVGGAIAIGYNLPGISSKQLRLTRSHLVGIYDGSIQWWNDTTIVSSNPSLTMPQQRILPVARLESSGTTKTFTTALAAFSSSWKLGVFSDGLDATESFPLRWNASVVAYYGEGNAGVASLVRSIRYSVAYLSLDAAESAGVKVATLINKAGSSVVPSSTSVQAAMNYYSNNFTSRFTVNLVDCPASDAYPLSMYTYFVIYLTTFPQCDTIVEFYRFVDWLLFNEVASNITLSRQLTPVPLLVATRIKNEVLSKIRCGAGLSNVPDLVAAEIQSELLRDQVSYSLYIYIGGGIVGFFVLLILALLLFMLYRNKRDIIKNVWRVNFTELQEDSHAQSNPPKDTTAIKSGVSKSIGGAKIYQGNEVSLFPTEYPANHAFTWEERKCLISMRRLNHNNVQKFYGLTEYQNVLSLIGERCSKGNLHGTLHNNGYNLDENLMFSLAIDVCQGMEYLHSNGVVMDILSSHHCFIDSRWTVKIADWVQSALHMTQRTKSRLAKLCTPHRANKVSPAGDKNTGKYTKTAELLDLWRSPETLACIEKTSRKCDNVYSYGVILVEIWNRSEPFYEEQVSHGLDDVIQRIANFDLRAVPSSSMPTGVARITTSCLSLEDNERPTFAVVLRTLKRVNPSKKSVLDCMMVALDNYINNLEEVVAERTRELDVSKRAMESLLHTLLPPPVAIKLVQRIPVEPESYDSVSIYFSDVCGFTTLSSECTPQQVMGLLNALYGMFDIILEQFDVYKVETIGDAYLVISGLPVRNGDQHAPQIAKFALAVRRTVVESFRLPHNGKAIQMRIGLHTGSVVAGIISEKLPKYCLFGDAVNTASRMESTSLPNEIQISEYTFNKLNEMGGFSMERRGEIEIKGKGLMATYFLRGECSKVVS